MYTYMCYVYVFYLLFWSNTFFRATPLTQVFFFFLFNRSVLPLFVYIVPRRISRRKAFGETAFKNWLAFRIRSRRTWTRPFETLNSRRKTVFFCYNQTEFFHDRSPPVCDFWVFRATAQTLIVNGRDKSRIHAIRVDFPSRIFRVSFKIQMNFQRFSYFFIFFINFSDFFSLSQRISFQEIFFIVKNEEFS